jgi:hypothetical protein
MANPEAAIRNRVWLAQQGITVPEDNIYVAPMYPSLSVSTNDTPSACGSQAGYSTAECPMSGFSDVGSTTRTPSTNGNHPPSASSGAAFPSLSDPALLDLIDRLRPRHIVVTIGGGTQERLGLFLKRNLPYRPAIHCIGAAIAFLSGDQVRIPVWADKYYLGWLLRSISEPKRYIPRYWNARKLLPLMLRHRSQLPTLKT